jgi:hypothetical protein
MTTYELAVYINGVEVKGIEKVSVRRSSDMKNSKAEITLKNTSLREVNTLSSDYIQLKYSMDDEVEIYAAYEDIPSDIRTNASHNDKRLAYLLFNGKVTQISMESDSKKNPIKLVCTDNMLLVMNKVRIANYRSTNLRDVLINLVQQAFEDKGTYTNYEIPTGLPTINYAATHRPLHEHILRVSSTDYTQFARNAIFKLIPDPANATFPYKFIWSEPSDAVSTTLNGAITGTDTSIVLTSVTGFPTEGSITIGSEVIRYTSISGTTLTVAENGRGFGDTVATSHADGTAVSSVMKLSTTPSGTGVKKIETLKLKRSEEAAVNMLIMRLGKDLFGRSITHYAYDVHSETKGLRMKIVDWKWVASNFYEENVGAKTQVATTLSNPSYPATLQLNDASSLATGTNYLKLLVEDNPEIIKVTYSGSGNNVTISGAGDRGEFNTAPTTNIEAGTVVADWTSIVALGNTTIRTNIKAEGRNTYAEDYFRFQNPRWTGDVVIAGNNLNPLGLVELNAEEIGVNNFPLRITDVNHSFDNKKWRTTIKLKEDELKV